MHAILDLGCALGGLAAGLVLYGPAAATAPPRPPATAPDDDAPGEAGGAADPAPPVGATGHDPPAAPPPPATVAGRLASGVVTGALCAAAAVRFGPVPALAPYAVLFCGLVALSVADLRVHLLPRRLLYPTAVLVAVGLTAASAAGGSWHDLWVAAVCAVAAFALFFALWWFFPRGMGFGDVRLAGLVGLALGWLGPLHLYLGLLASFVCGTLFGVVVMVVRGTGRRTKFAFGPSLAAGTVVGVLWGGTIINAWLGHGS